jgi:hypothetical protein
MDSAERDRTTRLFIKFLKKILEPEPIDEEAV